MKLHAIGGLCNRLQAILSNRAAHGELVVTWLLDDPCMPGVRFSDLFEPLAGVAFVDEGTAELVTFSVSKDAPDGWERGYLELVPKPAILARVKDLRVPSEYAAMHVRRSSHVSLAKSFGAYTDDAEFDAWMSKIYPWSPIYVATDNAETQRKWLARDKRTFANRTIETGAELQDGRHHHVHTAIADAVVDLYVCASARWFKGSGFSSFSETIERLRAYR